MGRPVKQKNTERKDPLVYPRYQAMASWTPRNLRGKGKR